MKTKKINEKLSFNKLTISNLSSINGGKFGASPTIADSLCLLTCNEYTCPFDTRCQQVGCI